jgi:hypothetical protein
LGPNISGISQKSRHVGLAVAVIADALRSAGKWHFVFVRKIFQLRMIL